MKDRKKDGLIQVGLITESDARAHTDVRIYRFEA